jgi:hypothetical protein
LPDAVLHNVRAANTARDRERRAARLQERRAEDAANDGCAGRTLHDFDAQAKQKIRDFISPSNMGRDTCACCNELNPPSEMYAQPPSVPPLFVLVELTSTILKATPLGQPPNLPPNVVALPMYKHKPACVDVQRVPNSTRHFVTIHSPNSPSDQPTH